MNNLYLYNKYVVRPQMLLKFPKSELKVPTIFGIRKIRMNMYMLDLTQNYYLFLYNICILIRILFNIRLSIIRVNKYFALNIPHLYACIEESKELYNFLDIFGTFLVNSFDVYNMGLSRESFDMFGNFTFEFNYCDPIFTTKNTIIIWSPTNKIRFTYIFHSKEREENAMYMHYLTMRFRNVKKIKKENNEKYEFMTINDV